MEAIKKYLAEFIGTFVLVLFGCGSAVVGGGAGQVGIALAFGLSIVAMAYSIGNVSGCHVNPAVSLAMLISKKMSGKDFIGYVVGQVLGAIAGAAVLWGITGSNKALGANGYGSLSATNLSLGGAIAVEIILTFVFVLIILGVTSKTEFSGVAGLVIGLGLTLIHILGIPLTGTSVNPARSIGPALFTGGEALSQLWVFIAAPLAGAAIAAIVWKCLISKAKKA